MPWEISMTSHTLPALKPDAKLKLPKQAERTLAGGLTVIAIRRTSVPLVELRLRVPFGRTPLPRATVLSRALVTGNALASGLDRMLEILAAVLTDPAYPNDEVATERDRLVDHIQVALT